MAGYLGHKPKLGKYAVDEFTTSTAQASSGNFTLSQTVTDERSLEVSVGGVDQPTTAYSISGTTLAFGTNIVAENDIVIVRHAGESILYPALEANAVDSANIVAGAVDDAHLATGITATKLTGTIAGARLPDPLPAIDGSALTSITHTPANNSVGLAQLAGGIDGNLFTWDTAGDPAYVATGTTGHVLTSGGTGVAPTFAAAAGGGGITETDWWRLTANITATNADITANLERVDTPAASYLGTGMAESSGIFTFPSTGYWIIMVHGSFEGASENSMQLQTLVTLNNSSYAWRAIAWSGQRVAQATGASGSSQLFLDVTSTTNVKVKFSTGSLGSGSIAHGSTDATANFCNFMFIRLGDT